MGFKEDLKNDLDVFYNSEEFAEIVDLDGEKLLVILSEVIFDNKYLYKEAISGLNTSGIILSITKKELFKNSKSIKKNFEISAGATLVLNDRKYSVIKFLNKVGDYDLHLERISEN